MEDEALVAGSPGEATWLVPPSPGGRSLCLGRDGKDGGPDLRPADMTLTLKTQASSIATISIDSCAHGHPTPDMKRRFRPSLFVAS